ncbi:MAG: putative transporter rane protein [Mycobacterium sp.]|nr:putative transporter rane protein [Mycobacterium sp.]MCW2744968.1 putative transporter rane protein [Mycobacterium sp.]
MIRTELLLLLRRPRTWVSIALLTALPVVVAVFLAVTGIAPRPGTGPAFLAQVLTNGTIFPAAALALILPLFLPVAVALVAGDAIAGEASAGTLRYLLLRPVGRGRLLVAKLVSVVAYVLLAVTVVSVAALGVGTQLFGTHPIQSLSGGPGLTTQQAATRVVISILYVAVSMLGVGAFGLFFSTVTDSPMGAALGALAILISSEALDLLGAAASVQPYLPTHYWLAFVDLFRNPALYRGIERGLGLQAVYVGVLLLASWAAFATKDITS